MKEEKLRELEVKLDEIRHELDQLESDIKSKTTENDVKVMLDEYAKLKKVLTEEEAIVTVDKILNEKRYMTENDVKTITKEMHITILKWVVGTTISSVALIIAILRVLF
ncbi:superfamily II RNA helicase [Evansella vedderi]|uniref:Superfamily II RNA helicase n=1 Tax=Evansella vedderi TaxID=38282 RepID=A0ABU0A0K1_9BACI|nr:hypothetical protein [Evansella vedderi]MDQ0256745.1 superfamily II RNA helicase [Evansella vedderi]